MTSVELASAYVAIIPETSKIAPGVRKALGGVERDADKTGHSMGSRISSGLTKTLKVGALAAGGVLAGGLGAALTKGLGRLTSIENAQAKMRGLGHDAKSVDTIMANALESVKGTAFGLGEAATIAASAVAAGIEPGDKLAGHLTRVANNAAAAGISMEDMGGIFNRAATQANGVQNDVISQLADRGIPIYQALADQMGVTAGEVFKLASEGKVDFETFSKAAEEAAGTVASEMGKTFTGSLSNAWAALGRVGANLLSGVFDKFAPAIQGVTEWLGKLEPVAMKVGEAIGEFATRAGEAFGRFVQQFRDGEGAGGKFRDVVEKVRDAVMVAFDYVRDTVIPVLIDMAKWVYDNRGALSVLIPMILGAFAALKTFMFIQTVTGAVRAFSAALLANPIGIVIAAIGALVGALVWLYHNNETVRAVIDRAWAGIKTAISSVGTWFKDVLWPWMKGVFDRMGATVMWLWNTIYKPYFTFIWDLLKRVGAWVKDVLWPWMRDSFQRIAEKAGNLKDRAKSAFDGIKSGISTAWDGAKKILDRFKGGLDSLKGKFGNVRDGIVRVWSTIGGAIARPINTVIDSVNKFLENLRTNLNKIPGVTLEGTWGKIPHVPVPGRQNTAAQNTYGQSYGGGVGGLADGGMVRGPWRGAKADNVLGVDKNGVPTARVNPREMVLSVFGTTKLLKKIGMGGLSMLNRGELPGFARGGLIGGSLGDALAGAGSWLLDMFTNPGKALKGMADKALSGIGGSWAGQAAMGVVGESMKKLATWVKDKVFGGEGPSGGGSFSGRGMRWPSIWAMVQAIAPEARMTSNYRPGARTSGYGNASLHSLGRAIDIVSPNMIATGLKLLARLPRPNEFIHTPLGGRQYNRGGVRTGNFPPITRAQHYDHIHIGYADGGLVKPLLFDSGGYLPTGSSLVRNNTGKPEPLMRMDKPMRISGTVRMLDNNMMEFVDARIQADHDHARYESRMVGA